MVSKKERGLAYVELARCSPLKQSSRVRHKVQVQMREIIEVACTRAPATAQPIGSVWKELLKGGTVAGGPVGCQPAETWVLGYMPPPGLGQNKPSRTLYLCRPDYRIICLYSLGVRNCI